MGSGWIIPWTTGGLSLNIWNRDDRFPMAYETILVAVGLVKGFLEGERDLGEGLVAVVYEGGMEVGGLSVEVG